MVADVTEVIRLAGDSIFWPIPEAMSWQLGGVANRPGKNSSGTSADRITSSYNLGEGDADENNNFTRKTRLS